VKAPRKSAPARRSLDQLRKQVDGVNLELLRLLSERARIAQEIGVLKRADGAEIYQPAREREVFDALIARNPGPLSEAHIRRIFREVISACTALERELRVAYLGPEHTYSHQAAVEQFGSSAALGAEASIAAVFTAIENDRADFGVVPVENSTEGSVTLTLDLLIDHTLVIVGEVMLPIRHALMSLSGDPAAISRIVSHQQSLGQCRGWLAANYPRCEQEAVASNTLAAMRAASDPASAAIAPAPAADAYGLRIIAEGIQDAAQNTTRFVVIGKQSVQRSGSDKTSIVFAVPHRAGALHSALASLARNSINMSKLESRPQRGRPWDYLFLVDLQGHLEDARVKRALAALAHKTLFLKVLGSYPEARPVR
jgi:chorismate mutase/prephenate dehydratase